MILARWAELGEMAYQINNKGQVVGQSSTATNPNGDPFLWDNGVLTDLGYPGGDVFGVAADINNHGQIVGLSASDPSDPTTYHALLWEQRRDDKSPGQDPCRLRLAASGGGRHQCSTDRSSARGFTTVFSAPAC